MSQLPLFDSENSSTSLTTDAIGPSYRRFVFHSEISENSAQKLVGSFLKRLRKIDPKATASVENVMSAGPWIDMPFLCVDVETTGLDRSEHRVIEIAWILFHNQKEVVAESRLCRIETAIPDEITELTGITNDMLEKEQPFNSHIQDFLSALSSCAFVVAYNANFDRLFIESEFAKHNISLPEKHWIDPCVFIKEIDKFQKGKKLTDASRRWGIELNEAHRAMADASATGRLLYKLASHLDAHSLPDLIVLQKKWQKAQDDSYKAYLARRK